MIPFAYAAIDDMFTALFFGTGAWLGFIIFVVLISGLALAWKPLVVVSLAISMLLGLEYLQQGLGWQSILMFIVGILVLFYTASKWKGGE